MIKKHLITTATILNFSFIFQSYSHNEPKNFEVYPVAITINKTDMSSMFQNSGYMSFAPIGTTLMLKIKSDKFSLFKSLPKQSTLLSFTDNYKKDLIKSGVLADKKWKQEHKNVLSFGGSENNSLLFETETYGKEKHTYTIKIQSSALPTKGATKINVAAKIAFINGDV